MKTIIVTVLLLLILCVSAQAGSLQVSWSAVTLNADGTPCTDLKGYKVFWGNITGTYSANHDVGNVLTYTITPLTEGIWYVAVKAYDTSNNESGFSNEKSATIIVAPAAPVQSPLLIILNP